MHATSWPGISPDLFMNFGRPPVSSTPSRPEAQVPDRYAQANLERFAVKQLYLGAPAGLYEQPQHRYYSRKVLGSIPPP